MSPLGAVYTHSDQPLVHQALLYGSDEEFLTTAGVFLREGLAAGEIATAVTTSHNLRLLRAFLGDNANVHYVEADSWYRTPGATLGAYLRVLRAHDTRPRRHRVIGEPVWSGRDDEELLEWTRYESVLNTTFRGEHAWILCPYDTRVLPGGVVSSAMRTHPEVVGGYDTWLSLSYRDPADFAAECDSGPLEPAVEPRSIAITPDGLRAVREFVAVVAGEYGLTDPRRTWLMVAVNELATNVVAHGGGHGELRLWRDAGTLTCEVADAAGELTVPHPGQLCPPPGSLSGHGLWVARQLCDLMQVRVDGGRSIVRVRMTLDAYDWSAPADRLGLLDVD
jgi:anti-sigma regulatory factor (Ser/Thr protein kinase)